MARNEEKFTEIFNALKAHAQNDNILDIREKFIADDKRFEEFSYIFEDLLVDFSKCACDAKTLSLLFSLAEAADLEGYRTKLLQGEIINYTESRPALHTALRLPEDSELFLGDRNIVKDVHHVLQQASKFCTNIREGVYVGETGKKIESIVNIGIGGSALGPQMAVHALRPYHDGPDCFFVSNIDGADIADCLAQLNPETTLFIVTSKTFTTVETLANAQIARQWIVDSLGERAIAKHFAAVSSAVDKVCDFGIESSYIFNFWNWVGGRYSVWSSVGLSIMLAIGPERFKHFLSGANAMDEHFATAPLSENIPVILGLIGYWHRVFCGFETRATIAYDQRLSYFSAYLQQLDMESNGKSVTITGQKCHTPTGPICWGGVGTNSQHAFFQLLHQGTSIIPTEFIVSVYGHEPNLARKHQMLIANCFAQSEALLHGQSLEAAMEKLLAEGVSQEDAKLLAPHRVFSGNRPSITIVHEKLTPFALGRLLALYEHRVFVEGVLMHINSFDQWGVELGKELANAIGAVLNGQKHNMVHDSSTSGLISYVQNYGRERFSTS